MEKMIKWHVVFVSRGDCPSIVSDVEAPTRRDAMVDALINWRMTHGHPWPNLWENYRGIRAVQLSEEINGLRLIDTNTYFPFDGGEGHFISLIIEEIEHVWMRVAPPDLPADYDEYVPSEEEIAYAKGEDVFPVYSEWEAL